MKSLLSLVTVFLVSAASSLAVTGGIAESSFAGATKETFNGTISYNPSIYDFGNGMVFKNISGGGLINYDGGYGMGDSPYIEAGRDGEGDGYFGTDATPASFSLNFASGTYVFGFSGAESVVGDGSFGRNGFLDIEFYNMSDSLIGSFSVNTLGSFAWSQWHGFSSDELIGKVVFNTVGHSVLDDVSFDKGEARVPEASSTLALLGLASGMLVFLRRRR